VRFRVSHLLVNDDGYPPKRGMPIDMLICRKKQVHSTEMMATIVVRKVALVSRLSPPFAESCR
jgi:hypothetical protein